MIQVLRPVRPELALLGEWNTSNLGDRAIHTCALEFLESCGWGVRSYALGSLNAVADPRPVRLNRTRPAPDTRRGRSWISPPLRRALRGVRQNLRILRLAPSLHGVHAIVVGGGALLSDSNLHFPQSLEAVRRLAAILGVPLACLGCGAEGDWSPAGQRALVRFLSACSLIATRDRSTAQRVALTLPEAGEGGEIGLFGDFCLDDALIARDAPHAPRQFSLAVNISQLSGPQAQAEQQAYENALVEVLRAYVGRASTARDGTLELFTTGVPEDAMAARRVLSRLTTRKATLIVPHSVQELDAVLRGSGLVVAARLHAAILALAAHTPVVGFSPRPKLAGFLDTVGLSDFSLGPQSPGVVDLLHGQHAPLWSRQREAMLNSALWTQRNRVREAMLRAATQCSRAEVGA